MDSGGKDMTSLIKVMSIYQVEIEAYVDKIVKKEWKQCFLWLCHSQRPRYEQFYYYELIMISVQAIICHYGRDR